MLVLFYNVIIKFVHRNMQKTYAICYFMIFPKGLNLLECLLMVLRPFEFNPFLEKSIEGGREISHSENKSPNAG